MAEFDIKNHSFYATSLPAFLFLIIIIIIIMELIQSTQISLK